MLKFFFKYQKIILVVGGSLLMVVFLLPAGGQFLAPNPATAPVGYIGDREISQIDIRQANGELELLRRTSREFGAMIDFYELDGLTWILAMHEAEANGVYMPLSHALFSARQNIQNTPGFGEALQGMGATEEMYAQALQHGSMFTQLQQMTLGVRRPSEQRLAHFAKDIRSKANIRMVPIKAADRIDAAPELTDAEIQAHFDKHKSDRPGESEPYGFGYRLPNRFKIEFVTIPVKRVATTIEVNDLDGQKYYLANPLEFVPKPGETNVTDPDKAPEGDPDAEPTDKPTTEDDPDTETPAEPAKPDPDAGEPEAEEGEAPPPAVPSVPGVGDPSQPFDPLAPVPGTPGVPGLEPAPKPLPYKQVRDKVLAKIREQRAAEKRDQIAQSIIGELTTALRKSDKAATNPSGYYDLADDYEPKPFEQVIKSAQEAFGVLVDYERIDDRWLTTSDVDEMSGLGSATIEFRDFPAPISMYLASAREFDTKGAGPMASERLQSRVHSKIVRDFAGNAYIFRLTAISPAHVPESLDESDVREMVVKDLKTLKVYEMLLKEQKQFLDTARNEGLTKLAENEDVEIVTTEPFQGRQLQQNPFTRSLTVDVPNLEVVGSSEAFVDGVFNIARKVEAAGGLGAGKAPPQLAVDAIPVDEKLMVAIVQLTEYEPLDSTTYAGLKPMLNGALNSLEIQQLGRDQVNPMSRDALAKRVGFTRPEGWDSEDDDATDAPTDDTEAAEEESGN